MPQQPERMDKENTSPLVLYPQQSPGHLCPRSREGRGQAEVKSLFCVQYLPSSEGGANRLILFCLSVAWLYLAASNTCSLLHTSLRTEGVPFVNDII